MSDEDLAAFKSDAQTYGGKPPHRKPGSNVRLVSSSLALTPRASAFLWEAAPETLHKVLEELPSMTPEDQNAEAGLHPLYFLDKDGQPCEFLDPAELKVAFRKLALR